MPILKLLKHFPFDIFVNGHFWRLCIISYVTILKRLITGLKIHTYLTFKLKIMYKLKVSNNTKVFLLNFNVISVLILRIY